MLWLVLGLGAAVGDAGADAVTKRFFSHLSPYGMGLVRLLYALPPLVLVGCLISWPPLDRTFWLLVAIMLPLDITAMLFYMKALKVCHLSLCIPFLAFTPVFLIFTGWAVLGEELNRWGIVGTCFIGVGSYVLSLGAGRTFMLLFMVEVRVLKLNQYRGWEKGFFALSPEKNMSPRTFEPRTYRTRMVREGLTGFRVAVKETDLWVLAARDLSPEVRQAVVQERLQLEGYIAAHPGFLEALAPWPEDPFAPEVVRDMIAAAVQVGVGPMAAVAGALAERVGRVLAPLSEEFIVENGGDIFLRVSQPATVALYAGKSPLSHRVGLKIDPAWSPLGVCTSSGTVGHSLSFGRADAACVLAASGALADAAATALGNRVPDAGHIQTALEWMATVPEILGAVIIVREQLGAWGRVELVPL